MPTATCVIGATRTWGLLPTAATGALAPKGNLVQVGIDRRLEAISEEALRTSYSDTGRSEQHDEHRKSVIEETGALIDLKYRERLNQLKIEKLEQDLEIAEDGRAPWEHFTAN